MQEGDDDDRPAPVADERLHPVERQNSGCASTVSLPKSTVRSRCGPVARELRLQFRADEQFSLNLLAAGGTVISGPRYDSTYSLSRSTSADTRRAASAGGTTAATN